MLVSDHTSLPDEIKKVTLEISYDPIPMTAVIYGETDYKVIKIEKQEVEHQTLAGRIKSLNLPNDNFCVLPWVALEIQPSGENAVCCLAEEPIKDAEGKTLTVSENSLDEILNAESLRQLRKDFLSGKKSKVCNKCWRVEDNIFGIV
jgi:hypothetical protein